ncbi:unnamed protein product [Penicillium palitans]
MTFPNIPSTIDYPIVRNLVVACRLSDDPVVRVVLSDGGPMPRMTVKFKNSKHGTLEAKTEGHPQGTYISYPCGPQAGALHTSKLLKLSGIGGKYRLNRLGIPLVDDQPAVDESPQNNVTSMCPVPLNPHPHFNGISLGFKDAIFVHLDQQEQSKLFTERSKSVGLAERVIRSIPGSPDEASAVLIVTAIPVTW